MSTIRFVNRGNTVWRGSTPRGGRIALAPGEFVTNPYFARFARLHSEKNDGKKPLLQEYDDGTPVGVEQLPENDGLVAPVIPRRQPIVPAAPPTTGCQTGCEAGCEFPAETAVSTVADINAKMGKGSPPLPATAFLTPAASMLATEHKLEPGIAPPIPSPAVGESVVPPAPNPVAPVAPQFNEGILSARTELQPEEVMVHFGLSEQSVLEVNSGYMKVLLEGKETYVSRYELGWKTHHLPSMKAHVTTNKSSV